MSTCIYNTPAEQPLPRYTREEMPERTSQDELEIMLTDILNRESKLTDWELNFIDCMSVHIEAKTGLSEKQDECFTAIWNRVTE